MITFYEIEIVSETTNSNPQSKMYVVKIDGRQENKWQNGINKPERKKEKKTQKGTIT